MKSMRYESLPTTKLGDYLADDEWIAEQKLDGCRLMIHVTDGKVRFLSGDERPVTFAAAALHFDRLTEATAWLPNCVIDGELIIETGVFWAFDLPYLAGYIGPEDEHSVRRALLETLISGIDSSWVALVPQARETATKTELWNSVYYGGQEGIVLKKAGAAYAVGRRTANVLKVKRTHTIDVIVLARNTDGAMNATLGLMAPDGRIVEVGCCSMIGKPDLQPGDCGEVEYLYATAANRLYQPRLSRPRPDKVPTECRWEQITTSVVSRVVVGA